MRDRSVHVQPPLEFVPPDFKPGLARLLSAVSPLLMTQYEGICRTETRHIQRLVDMYRRFQAGEARFLIAFRHSSTVDPVTILYLLGYLTPRAATREGVTLRRPTHTYFLYDRGVPLWAGPAISWLLPRMGGISLQRGKLDRNGLKAARQKFAEGDQPMAVAPEGATNGLSELVSPVEPGAAQLAFWCLEDLRAKGSAEQVFVLPLGIKYALLQPSWEPIERLLARLESDCGLAANAPADRYARLLRIAEHLLTLLEEYYARFYQQNFDTPTNDLTERMHNVMEAALRTSEQFFAIQPRGTLTDRCRRIEQAGWDRIYREDLKGRLSPVQRGLADRVAEEADRRMWHMRAVETFVFMNGSYVSDNPTIDRFAETVALLAETVDRFKGAPAPAPPRLGKRCVTLEVAEPILIDDRYDVYTADRKGARKAVADLTRDLQQILNQMAEPESTNS